MPNILIPQSVSLEAMACKGSVIKGRFPVLSAKRVLDILFDETGEIEVELQFGIDQSHFKTVKSFVCGDVYMQCQRCLEPIQIEINSEVLFAAIRSDEEAKVLPERYEPLIVEDGKVNLHNIVEDELLLCLPLIPAHANKSCSSLTFNEKQNDKPENCKLYQFFKNKKPLTEV